jgi:hypothetical protein
VRKVTAGALVSVRGQVKDLGFPGVPSRGQPPRSPVSSATEAGGEPRNSACARQTELWVLGRVADVQVTPTHISSVDPSPQVTKWGGTLRKTGSSWARVGL